MTTSKNKGHASATKKQSPQTKPMTHGGTKGQSTQGKNNNY